MMRRRLALTAALLFFALRCGTGGGGSESRAAGGSAGSVDAAASDGASGDMGVAGSGGAGGAQGDAAPEAAPEASTGLGPPYPIVLAHGFFGFEQFAGVDFVTYFFEVKDHLAASGEANVFTPAVDPFNDSTFRGAQLEAEIEKILATTGHEKVNIVGHSQGGLDARVVAHDRPDLVASVTMFATPNRGTRVADVLLRLINDPRAAALIDALVQVIGAPIYDQIGMETAVSKPLNLFSESGIAAFNAKYPDSPGVLYFSITGRTDLHLGVPDCQTPDAPPFVTQFQGKIDPVDPLLSLPEEILDEGLLDPIPNDGLVTVPSAKWGTFLGCVPADHLDEVGQLLGDLPGLTSGWSHKQFFVDLVAYLRAQGL